MDRYLFSIACCFGSGIIIGRYAGLEASSWLALGGAAFFFSLLFFYLRRRLIYSLVLICFIVSGAFWYNQSRVQQHLYEEFAGSVVEGKGVISSYPRAGSYNLSFTVGLSELALKKEPGGRSVGLDPDRILLNVPIQGNEDLLPGMTVEFYGELFVPAGAKNPGTFDYREYLANQGVFYGVRCRAGEIGILSEKGGLQTCAARGRLSVSELLKQLLPAEERGLLLGLLFGDVSAIDDRDWEGYQRAGVVHLFAVSGFNIAFVLGIAWFLLSFFRPGPLWRLLWGVFILCGYYFLVGWSASLVRASWMAFFGLLALCFGRKKDFFTSLALAALLILLFNPGEIFQAGFQLTFLATAGIAYLSPPLLKLGLGRLFSPTLAAQMATLPLSVSLFHLISLVAPLLNVVAILISGAATVLALLGCLAVWFLPVLAAPLFLTAGSMMYALSRFVLFSADFDWACLVIPKPPLFFIVMVYLLLLALPQLSRIAPLLWRLPLRIKGLAAIVLFLGCLVFAWPEPPLLEAVFLDVGQGDSIFIRTPGGRTCLLDGGGTPDSDYPVGLKVVKPYLQSRGVRTLDFMIMSHNDCDHCEGLLEIIPYLSVGMFLMPPAEPENRLEAAILGLCREKNIPCYELTAGQSLKLDEQVQLEVLSPAPGSAAKGNNSSLVLRLSYGENTWLLTGDAEQAALAGILDEAADIRADILKLPHHGSISSYHEGFYLAADPEAVVASAGVNSFNHPHPRVVAFFEKAGIPVYVTKRHGAVMTEGDGRTIRVSTVK